MSITTESIPFYEIGDISGLQTALDAKVSIVDFNIALANKLDASLLPSLAQLGVNNTFTANQTINANLVVGGTFTATARAHFRGDGTNPVVRFESSSGQNIISVRESDHTILFGTGSTTFSQIGLQTLNNPIAFANGNGHYLAYKSNVNIDWPSPMHSFWGENQIYSRATLVNNPAGIAAFNGTFGISNVAASTFDYRMLSVNYTINNTAVSNRTATGILLNATETALNGMTHNLMDLQVGGVSRFSVTRFGQINITGAIIANGPIYCSDFGLAGGISFLKSNTSGIISLYNNNSTDFNRLQFGGTTNLFPSLKRNGIELQTRLADDSGYANFAANIYTAYGKTNLAASTASFASLNIKAGTTPTMPIDGDIWSDGTDLYYRLAGANKKFAFSA